MSETPKGTSSTNWNDPVNHQYKLYQYAHTQAKAEGSSTGTPLKMETSASNPDAMSALIGIINTSMTTSISDLKTSMAEVKSQSETDSKEIKDKIDKIKTSPWASSLLEPTTIAILSVLVLIITFILVAAFNKFTGATMNDVKDYILLFGGGLVGFLGGDKMKK
ncbi:hypothetical protein QMZ65_25040, partial [Pantoea sp. EABMAA-21]|uniref:hypothetical protein n=1 Tax=Pantoea sp. EABMAA-21 TaxID=3043302 RepID=UPI0024B56A1F